MARDGILPADEVRGIYDRMAGAYDRLNAPYALLGGYRMLDRGVRALGLATGDVAVDLGTGTGMALPELSRAVGPSGRVVGVDLSPEMLGRARQRCDREGLSNVELVRADVGEYAFPEGVRGVHSAYSLEMVPEYDRVVARAVEALPAGGGIAVLGLRDPERWPRWAAKVAALVARPFGIDEAYEAHEPWASVAARTTGSTYDEGLGGLVYLATGRAPG